MNAAPSRHRDGFTLIELMIVVVIIGILAAIAVPKFAETSRAAKEAEAGPLLKQIVTLQERYRSREGSYASDITLLEGGPDIATGGKYYSIGITGAADNFCATATPNALGSSNGVRPFSMDASRQLRQSPSC